VNKYQIDLELPTAGINLIDASLIASNEAAENTKNMSFKNGEVCTRKGYVKNFEIDLSLLKPQTLLEYINGTTRRLMYATGIKLRKYNGTTFVDVGGSITSDKIETIMYPSALGYQTNVDVLSILDGGVGTLAAGTYHYQIVAITPRGDTGPSEEKWLTVTASKAIVLTWAKHQTATGYKIYGRAQGSSKQLLATVGDVTNWTDTGSITPSGAMSTTNMTATAYLPNMFVVDGTTYQYYNDTADALAVVPAYAPNTSEVSAYGTNVLLTTPSEINNQKFILNDDERIWVAGYNNLVRISHLQKPDYFPSTQVWKLREPCTGMKRFMGEVVLFTENTVTLISGKTPIWSLPDKYIYTELPTGFGCSQHRTIAIGDNAMYWANDSGVYRYRYLPSGYSIPECVSEFTLPNGRSRTVRKWFKDIDWTKAFAEFYEHEYRLYIGNKKVLVFNTLDGSWALYEYNRTFNCSLVSDYKLLYADDRIYHMDYVFDPTTDPLKGLSDDGAPIEFVLGTKYYDFSKAANKKKFKRLYVSLYSPLVGYDIDVVINIDNEYQVKSGIVKNLISKWGDFKFGDKINTKDTNLNYKVPIRHQGKRYNIQFVFKCANLNQMYYLKQMTLLLQVKELK
jgi:hypothetical protein